MGKKLPTAFFAANDLIAFGAMRAFKEKSINIPNDISVVGFDDLPFCSMSDPALTTISVDQKLFGEHAVQRLLEIMNNDHKSLLTTSLDVDLVIRNSVKEIIC